MTVKQWIDAFKNVIDKHLNDSYLNHNQYYYPESTPGKELIEISVKGSHVKHTIMCDHFKKELLIYISNADRPTYTQFLSGSDLILVEDFFNEYKDKINNHNIDSFLALAN